MGPIPTSFNTTLISLPTGIALPRSLQEVGERPATLGFRVQFAGHMVYVLLWHNLFYTVWQQVWSLLAMAMCGGH